MTGRPGPSSTSLRPVRRCRFPLGWSSDRTGTFIDIFATGGELSSPAHMQFGPDRNLYVASRSNDEILRYDGETGQFIDVFASGGGLSLPYGLAFGPDGNLYVSSVLTSQVLRYNGRTGEFMGVFASGGGLSQPSGLSFRRRTTTRNTEVAA